MVKAFQLKHKGLVAITLEEEDEEEEEDHDEPVAETRVEESEGDSSDDDNPNNNKDSNNGPSHSKANDQRTPLGLGGGKRNSTVVAAGAASSASSPNRRRLNRHASSSGGAAATGSDGGGDSDFAASFHNLRISPSLAGAFQSSPSPRCGARVLYLPTSLRLQFDEKRELLFNRYGLKLLAIKQFFQTHMNPLLLIQYKHWGSQQTVPLPKQLGVTLDVAGLAVRMATAPMRAPSSRKAQNRSHRKSSKPSPTDAAPSQRSNAERSAEIIHRHSRLFSSLFREVPCVTTFLQNAFWFFFLEFYSLAESVDRFDQHRIDLVDGLSYTVENIIGDEAGAGEDDPRHMRTATIVEPENPAGGGAPQSSVARGSISPKGAPPLIGFPPTSAIAATTTVQDEDRNAILMLLGPAAGSAGARNKSCSGGRGSGVQRELDNAFRLHHDSTAGGGGAAAAMQASFLSGSLQSSVRRPKMQQQPTASRSTTAHHSGPPQQGRLGASTTTTNQEGPTSGGGPASSSSSGSDSDDAILGAPDATHKKRKQKGALHDGKNSGNVTQSGGGAVGGSASVLHNSGGGGGGGGGGGVNMEAQRRITLLKQFSRRYLTRTSKTPSHVIHEADYQLRFRGRQRTSHHRRSHRRGPGGGDDALSSTRDSSGSEDGYTSAMSYGTLVSSPGSATTEDGEEDPLNDDHLAYLLSAEGKKTHDEEEEEFPLPLRTPDPLNGPRVPLSARSKKLRKSLRTPSTVSHRGGGTAGSGAPAPNVRLVQGERDPMQAVLLLLHSGCLDLTQEQFDALVHELHSTSPEAVVKEQLLIRDACELIEIEQHRIFGRMARSYLAILKAVRQGSVSASSNYRGECTTTNAGLTPRVPSSAPTSALRPSTSTTTATTVLESSIPPLALTSLSDKRDGARAEAELVAQHLPYFLAKVVTQLLYLLMPYGRDILTRRARRHIFKKMTYWALGVEDGRLPKAPLPVPPPKKSAQSTGGDFNGSGGGGGGPITQQQQNPSASLLYLNESRRSPRAGGGARHEPCPPSLNASLRGGGPRTVGAVSSPRTGGAAATSHGQSTVGGRSVRNAISPDSNLAHTNNNNNNPATLLNTLSSANVTLPSVADTEAEERQLAMERGLEAFHKARADITTAFDYLLATGNVQLMNAATHSTMRPNSRHSTVSGGGAGDEGGDPLFAAAAAAGAAAATRRRKKAQEELRHLETHRHAPSNRLPELWHAQGRPSSRAVGLLLSDANKGRFDTALLTPFTKRVLVEQGIDIHRDTNKKMVRWTS